MLEESNDGQTTAIDLLKPRKDVTNVEIRKYVLYELLKNRGLSLTETALHLAEWVPEGKSPSPYPLSSIEEDLRSLCLDHERPHRILTEDQRSEIPHRAFMRAARYLRRIHTEGAPADSRVVELFIHDSFVPHGKGKNGSGHREHVVPCAYLRDKSVAMYRDGASIADVSAFLKDHVVIIEITPYEKDLLDNGEKLGGIGLKDRMPDGWDFSTGCIFDRLHLAKIEFDPPPGYSACSH
jgi:hypothetical protein